jgi:hypothetical protein
MKRSLLLSSISLVAVASSSCGGTPAEAIRPKDQTYASAMGEPSGGGAACRDPEAYGEPLVVEWKPEQRGDLEVLMRDGVAIVAHDCEGLKLLKDCKVDGRWQRADGLATDRPRVHATSAARVHDQEQEVRARLHGEAPPRG